MAQTSTTVCAIQPPSFLRDAQRGVGRAFHFDRRVVPCHVDPARPIASPVSRVPSSCT